MPRAVRTLAVVLLVALAGCNGLFGAFDGGHGTTTASVAQGSGGGWSTATAAPARSAELAPGLWANGTIDARRLARAHADALANATYTLSIRGTVEFDNGSIAARTTSRTRIGAGGALAFSYRVDGPHVDATRVLASNVDTWSNGTTTLTRIVLRNGSVRYERAAAAAFRGEPTARAELQRLYSIYRFQVVHRFTRNGTTYYRLHSTGVKYGIGGSAYAFASATILIDETGLVHLYHVKEPTAGDSGSRISVRTVQFDGIDDTTVLKPVWYAEALANTSPTNGTAA